jgi:hypothetical protein
MLLLEKPLIQSHRALEIAAIAPAGSVEALFKGRQFDQEINRQVGSYLRYKLSARDLVETMAERRAVLVHTRRFCFECSTTYRMRETLERLWRPA